MFGKEFNVSYLAYGLGISYLECVERLDAVSREGGIVFDLKNKDDIYQFRSQILLDAIREVIGYSSEGIRSSNVSQIIRHFHALAATALEKDLPNDRSAKRIMAIANHYYAAGRLYIDQALDYSLEAAKACRRLFEYDKAISYLDRVDELASLSGKKLPDSETLRLLIECDRSNVTGKNAAEAATKTLDYLVKHPDAPDELKIAAARACYDAGAQNGSQEWFARAVTVSREQLLGSDKDFLQVEGHHFIGISLNPRDPTLTSERFKHLEKAVTMAKPYPMIYARVANSLAEALNDGDEKSEQRAKTLFLESLEIKESAEIKDLPGIARSYGGLGRLAYFSKTPRYEEAREYFLKDLEISLEIKDTLGISKMNSFLGGCFLKEGKYAEALKHFDKSIAMENNYVDMHSSYEGKFKALHQLRKTEELLRTAHEYLDVLNRFGNPPKDMAMEIVSTLKGLEMEPDAKRLVDHLKESNDV